VKLALEAAEILASQGIEAEVIDLRTIKPLDTDLINESVRKTNRLVTVEEGWFFGGVNATIATIVMQESFDYLDAPIATVCAKDVPLPYAANLEKAALPSVEEIVMAAKKVCYK
jgi:pyruvate dehydrogenase E1 component beta subunit